MIPLMIGIPLLGAVCCALCGKKYGKSANYAALAAELLVLLLAGAGFAGGFDGCWLPLVGGLHFAADGFRCVWVLLIAFAFSMSGLMCPEYLAHGHAHARYQAATLLTLAGTLGVFLAANLFTFFVCFELMSLSSWLWVLHEETGGAKYAADTYLAVAVLGGLVLLMGIFVISGFDGMPLAFTQMRGYDFSRVPHGLLYLSGGLLLFGFGAKAGLFPLHFWLPMAHPVAPAPASALLSGVLTKCGVLGMLLLASAEFPDDLRWGEIVLALGVVTMVLGAVLAVCSVDLKRTLACSSVSQIGFITVGVGLMSLLGAENILAVRGTLLHMVNHTLIKLVLFLAAGVFAMNRGTLDLNRLRGAGRGNLPLLLAFLTGAYSVAGIPGGSGYLSKTMLHEAIVEYTAVVEGSSGGLFSVQLHVVEWLFLLSGGLTLAYMLKLFWTLFLAEPAEEGKPLHMAPATLAALALPSVVLWALGLAAHPLADRFLDQMHPVFTSAEMEHMLHYFSAENLKGAAISICLGLLVYFLIVRRALMKDGAHRNPLPEWLDLEKNVYRPLLLKVLPAVLGLACRIADNALDAVVLLLRKTVCCDLGKPRRLVAGSELSDLLGRTADRIVVLLNHTIRRKKPIERRSYVYVFAEIKHATAASGRLVTASLSFGLLMACVGLVATLVYLLV